MKKEDLPQDKSKLENFTREMCYVKNKKGEYEQVLSSGWDVKAEALEGAWEEVENRIEEAKKSVARGALSPIVYFMELNIMDMSTLAAYTGFWRISIKRHFKPKVFQKLSTKKLLIYAKAFKITIEELKNFNGKD
ncbi:MAG: hypothetical protein MK207_14665 [Saprospiraceae bacterium]|nr:hypothetical protein [Saprospiraceae bacterium]